MSLKILLILSLVAAVSANPSPVLDSIPDLGDILNIGSTGLGKTIGPLFKTVNGFKSIAKNIIGEILDIKIRFLSDLIKFVVKVVLGLADAVEASICGLGKLLALLVGFSIKVILCFSGYIGDVAVCSNGWNTQFGANATAAVSIQALGHLFGVTECYSKVQSIITIITRGGGIAVCKGSIGVVLEVILDFASLIQKVINGTYKLVKADLTLIFRKIAIILGVIGNSHKSGSGLEILNDFIPTCDKYLKSAGYPTFGDWTDIQVIIGHGNGDNAPWAIADVDASVSVDVEIGSIIGGVLKIIHGVTRLAVNLIEVIVGLVIKSFDDIIILVVKILLALGGLLDSIICGLGTLLVRIVAALLKIVLCFLGGSGKYGVCQPGWGKQFGIDGEASTMYDVISLYGVSHCKAAVNAYIYIYTKGKGIYSLVGSELVLFKSCVTLAGHIDAGKFDHSILVIVIRHIAYLLGAVLNSNGRGVGTKICNKFIPTCNKYLTDEGYTGLGSDLDDVITVINGTNDDNYIWSADIGDYKGSGFVVGTGVSATVGVGGVIGGIIGGVLGGAFQIVKGVTLLVSNILTDIFIIKINAIADVCNLIKKLGLAIGGALESIAVGLGWLFVRIVAFIGKCGVCVHGYPGDSSMCNKEWNTQFGVHKDEGSTEQDLRLAFELLEVEASLTVFINLLTNNKGIASTDGSLRIVLENCQKAAVIASKEITKQSMADILVILVTISAAIANSNKEHSGKQIVHHVIPTCGKYLTPHGYPDINAEVDVVLGAIINANNDKANWTIGGSKSYDD